MFVTFKRLFKNGTLMLNNISSLFYFFGYIPYWTFSPKYIETQYRQSASTSRYFAYAIFMSMSKIETILVRALICFGSAVCTKPPQFVFFLLFKIIRFIFVWPSYDMYDWLLCLNFKNHSS